MSGVLSQEELALLQKTVTIRERLLDQIAGPNATLPDKPREMDALVNVIESIDRSLLGKAKIKIDDANGKSDQENRDLLNSLLISMHKGEIRQPERVADAEVPSFVSNNMELLPGELISGQDMPSQETLNNL